MADTCDMDELYDARSKTSAFRTMFGKATRYQTLLHKIKSRKGDDQDFLHSHDDDDNEDDDQNDSFADFNPSTAIGMNVFDNPLMDTCNLIISMAGVCDVSKPTLADISNQSRLGEDLCYMDDSELLEIEEEDIPFGIKEVSVNLIKKVPVRQYPAGIVSDIEEGSTVDKESLQLPVSTRLWIERLVRNRMQTLKSEERLEELSSTQYKELVAKLTESTKRFLLDQIKAKITRQSDCCSNESGDLSTSSDDDD